VRVLFFSPYPPYPPTFGGTVRIWNLMRQAARRHEVYSLCYVSPFDPVADRTPLLDLVQAHVEVPRPHPERKRWNQARSLLSRRSYQHLAHRTRAMQAALERMVAEHDIDVVVVEFSQMACFDMPAGPAVVLDEHNVEWDLLQREYRAAGPSLRKLYQWSEYRKFEREERAALAAADVATVTSVRDQQLILATDPQLATPVEVVENGVDIDEFRPSALTGQPDTLVFTGTMHYHPNTQAARWFVEAILPSIQAQAPGARFIGAGGRVPPELAALAGPSVHFTGFVDDMREWFHRAAVLVVPLLVGGGTRFKVVEALAMGKPVVSTRLGAEGIPVEHGKHLLLADTPDEFAAATVELLRDKRRADVLAAEGRRFVERHFAWHVIGERLEQALQAAVTRREARRTRAGTDGRTDGKPDGRTDGGTDGSADGTPRQGAAPAARSARQLAGRLAAHVVPPLQGSRPGVRP